MRTRAGSTVSILIVAWLGACADQGTPDDRAGNASCSSPAVECAGVCVDLAGSAAHCGACGAPCEAGQSCERGQCVCGSGQVDCEGVCVSTDSDPRNCGACGRACDTPEVCSSGACSSNCGDGLVECARACVDTGSDPANCGACARRCAAGRRCLEGSCACPEGTLSCGGACVDAATDPLNCGACGSACGAGQRCVEGSCAGGGSGGQGGEGPSSGGGPADTGGSSGAGGASGSGGSAGSGGGSGSGGSAPTDDRPPPGNPEGQCAVPAGAGLEDVSSPTTIIGDGSPESCTSDAVVAAVAQGGVITFNCGPGHVTIPMHETAKVFNDAAPAIVIDGGYKVTLSGQGERRILYMNTCDEAQHYTSERCDDQDTPRLTVQNITFAEGDSTGQLERGGGGGAIFALGGHLKIVNSRFFGNVCDETGQDLGGGAVRALMQGGGAPVYVVGSTFGGRQDLGNQCSNGGGVSSIGVSWTIINSLFSYNRATGNGGNPAEAGTPGGGSGGAIYNDGNTMTLTLCGDRIEQNEVNAYGSAIFFVSNDHTGDIRIDDSVITNNIGGSWYPTYPQISNHDDTPIVVNNSTIE